MFKQLVFIAFFYLGCLTPCFPKGNTILNASINASTDSSINSPKDTDDKVMNLERVEPPFWWIGMNNPVVELLIYQPQITDYEVSIEYTGVRLQKVSKAESPNYLFVQLSIEPIAKAGKVPIVFTREEQRYVYQYELKERNTDRTRIKGLTSKDAIYLVFPDRFSNGNTENDAIDGLHQVTERNLSLGRHGGDLQGIINHLDYIADLGFTAIWLNPEIENNQPKESYHGYAATDFYKIDPRFGTNELYCELVKKANAKGIKIIKDVVLNHIGDQHWWMEDLPAKSWLNQHEKFTRTTYRAPTLLDPYAAKDDKNKMQNGWFDHHMPDLNQRNPHLATYLIQNNIWWIEYAGIDAFRIDTYAYSDDKFTAKWAKAIFDEYPAFGMFGETWVHGVVVQSYFTGKNKLKKDIDSNLPGVTDFQLYYAINEALTREQGWIDGAARIYYTLAKDIAYANPYQNVLFLDNHDLTRFSTVINGDLERFKTGIAFLMTMRGIPMLYYGTEVLMAGGPHPDHGYMRKDFPGGWEGDAVNKFTATGRTEKENKAFNYVKKLTNYRKNNPVLQTGKLTQFVPENGVYVYFRYNGSKTVMIVMNTHKKETTIDMKRYAEHTTGHQQATNVITDQSLPLGATLSLKPYQTLILELK